MSTDIRWQQRFANYNKALAQLQKFIDKGELNDLEEQGLIQAFEFTHELAWNVIKDYFDYQGSNNIYGSRDATREAFQKGIITDGEGWMEMIKSRNLTSHTYNVDVANDIREKVMNWYFDLFIDFQSKMQSLIQ